MRDHNDMKTLTTVTLILAFASSVYAGAGMESAQPAPSAPAAPAVRGRVVFMEGDVEIDGRAAEIGTELGARSVVRTGPGANCEIVFADKNAVRVSQNATATLDFSRTIVQIDLEKGGVTSVLRKLAAASGDDSFRIRTAGAVAGVRGTSLCVWADATSTYVCACNGTVHTVDAKGGNEFTTEASHHQAKIYSRAGESISVEAAGMLHHTDESVESLAARIGEKIDWTVPD